MVGQFLLFPSDKREARLMREKGRKFVICHLRGWR